MILALDASTQSTGWAVFDNQQLKDYGCIKASNPNKIHRIQTIAAEIRNILEKHTEIDTIIMEEVLPEGKGHRSNPTVYKALMYLQAAIAFLVYNYYSKSIVLDFIYPNSWRKDCGIKTGPKVKREELKKADMAFVKDKFGISANDDTCDAIGIGWSYVQSIGLNWK